MITNNRKNKTTDHKPAKTFVRKQKNPTKPSGY